MREKLETTIINDPVRNCAVGTTDFNTGDFHTFNTTLPLSNFLEAVMSSAAPPVFFPP